MISLEEKMAIVKNTEIFSKVPQQYLKTIAERMGEKQYSAGTILFREGDPGHHMLIIAQGQVEIVKGESTVLATLGEGDILGEMAPILGEKRSTTARAREDLSVLFLKGEALQLLMHKIPDLAIGLMKLLCRRLLNANSAIQNLGKEGHGTDFVLKVEDGGENQQKMSAGQPIVIGRGNPEENNPMRLNLKGLAKSKISRRHAEIFYRNGNYFIKDLGSRNGTKLNDVRLEEIVSLKEGDRIQIGEASLCFCKE